MAASSSSSIFKRRSAHGFFSSPQNRAISAPLNVVRLDRSGNSIDAMGNDRPLTTATVNTEPMSNGSIDGANDDSAYGEPLIQDFQQLHNATVPQVSDPKTPVRSSSKPRPLSSHPITSSDDDEVAPPPSDLTRRGIHIPTRTSSRVKVKRLRSSSREPGSSMSTTPESRERSSADSVISYATSISSSATIPLAPLQNKGPPDELNRLEPLLEDDPRSFDLLAPTEAATSRGFSLEKRSEQLFSREHLLAVFKDPPSLIRFTSFLSSARPQSVPVLIYYLDALKAMRAINYANAVAEALEPLEGHDFTQHPARPTVNSVLEDKARQAFDALVREDLPAYITHIFIQTVSVSIQRRITGTLPPLLREASEGLAEVFCLTDPSRPDNPIIFASEEFHRTTQYGVSYAIGRNCRFLQGPRTNRNSIARIRAAVTSGKEISEVFLNYRRDGSPFMNLLMTAPLLDSRGVLRYFIGAQVDVSGLVKDCTDLDALQLMLGKEEGEEGSQQPQEPKDEFQELSEMFNMAEMETVRRFGGSMHREHIDEQDDTSLYHRPRLLLKDPSSGDVERPRVLNLKPDGRLSGIYKNYILIRPYPSLRILFTSPSLRVPGILQSRFLDRIGGSSRVRDSLAEALSDGTRGVTAKIRWLSSPSSDPDSGRGDEGRLRWIHCTPLLGHTGAVGVWMVVLVDDDRDAGPVRRFRQAPPVSREIRRMPKMKHDFDGRTDSEDEGYSRTNTMRRDGWHRNPVLEARRRPENAMSSQRASRSGSPAPAASNHSINSFALG